MSTNLDLQSELITIGLEERESVVYLACLHNAKTTPSILESITAIKRTSLYPILQKLLNKNLIYKKTFSKNKYIFAHPPKYAMLSIGTEAKIQADHIAKTAEKLINKLESGIDYTKYQPSTDAIFLSGRPGIRELIHRVLDVRKDIYWLGPSKIFLDLDKNQQRELFQQLTVKRMDNGTTAYAMTDTAFETSFYFHGGSEKFRQLRTIDLPKSLDAMIVVTGDLCAFVKSFDKKSQAVIFQDANYAELLKFTLKALWESLPNQ